MNDAMTNFQLGKIQHQEHNAWAVTRRKVRNSRKLGQSCRHHWLWGIIGVCLLMLWGLMYLL